jgi:hypothetical protein
MEVRKFNPLSAEFFLGQHDLLWNILVAVFSVSSGN